MTQQNPTVAFVLILGALSAFGPMSIDMYLPAFPALGASLHTTPGHVAYTLSAFFIGLSAGQLAYGPLADRFGRKPPLIAGLVLYALASIGCALAPTIEVLIAMRALQAFGACAGMVMSRAMVRDLFEPSAAARVFSLLILVMGLAPILAPFLGGMVLAVATWREIFWSLVAFGVACLAASAWALPESLPPEGRVKLGLGEIASVYGQLLTDRLFMGYSLSGALAQAGMFAYIAGSPFVFITLNGVPESRYGLLFGMNALGFVAVSQINAALLKRIAPTTLLSRGLAFATLMAALLAVNVLTGWGGFPGLLAALFGFVASLGFIGPNAMASALASRRSHHGQASAMLGTVQFGMATLAGLAVGALQDGSARPMGLTIAACGLLALIANQLTNRARRAVPAEAAP